MVNLEDRFKEDLTTQQIFDIGITYLASRDRRAVDALGRCTYRGPYGCCAAGYFISDEEYNPEMERRTIYTLVDNRTAPARLLPHVLVLSRLQAMHDDACPWLIRGRQSHKDRARLLAMELKLDGAIIDQVVWVESANARHDP